MKFSEFRNIANLEPNLVTTVSDIETNIQTLDEYLYNKIDPEYEFAINLILRGTCFIAKKQENSYRFYPSRFIGYADKSYTLHESNFKKDGRVTNRAISHILGTTPQNNSQMNKEYIKFCEELGFIAREKGNFGTERKFWIL